MSAAMMSWIGVVFPSAILIALGAIASAAVIWALLGLYFVYKYRSVSNCPEKTLLKEVRKDRIRRRIARKPEPVYTGHREVI